MKKRVAILTGGTSSEREIALASAEGVKSALGNRFDVLLYILPEDMDKFLSEYHSINVAIPVFHGRGGEDGVIQGFLRALDIPFIFSDVEAQALAANKALAKNLVASTGVGVPKAIVVSSVDEAVYESPVVIKPLDGGSSIGVSIVKDKSAFVDSLTKALALSSAALVENFIEGKEYTVAVVDRNGTTVALPVIAIRPKKEFFDLQSKYDPSLVEEICPARIADELAAALKEAAIKAHQVIGAQHISRSDFIVDSNGEIWFLEINTIPGQTANSLVPKALKAAGIDFGELLAGWIEAV